MGFLAKLTSLVVTVGPVGLSVKTTFLLWGITSRVTLSVATRVTSVVLGTIEGIVAGGDFGLSAYAGWALRFGLPLSNIFTRVVVSEPVAASRSVLHGGPANNRRVSFKELVQATRRRPTIEVAITSLPSIRNRLDKLWVRLKVFGATRNVWFAIDIRDNCASHLGRRYSFRLFWSDNLF